MKSFKKGKNMAKNEDIKKKYELEKTSNNNKKMNDFLKEAEEECGKGCVFSLFSEEKVNVKRCSSGFLSLDEILGGGFPYGRIIEIFGPEATGKTTLALHAIAEVQKVGGLGLFIDAEHSLNPAYVKNIGIKNLLFSQPEHGESIFKILSIAEKNKIDIVVVDSVASLVPKAEIEGDITDNQIALQARLMSKGVRKLVSLHPEIIIIFINQLRSKAVGFGGYGNLETPTGGNALKYFSSIRLEMRKSETLKVGDKVIGSKIKIKTIKNKVASPYQECFMDLIFGEGFDKNGDILEMALKKGIIKKMGSWYEYNNKKIAQGRENAISYLKNNPKETEMIVSNIKNKIK